MQSDLMALRVELAQDQIVELRERLEVMEQEVSCLGAEVSDTMRGQDARLEGLEGRLGASSK